jgi:hypothetical protein
MATIFGWFSQMEIILRSYTPWKQRQRPEMDSKAKAGDALKTFCREFGVPDKLRFDGSKEQTGKKTEFQEQIRKNIIRQHVSEPNIHNQSQQKVLLGKSEGDGTGSCSKETYLKCSEITE